MKILYISTMFPTNGDTIYTDLAEALKDAGHEVTVVATSDWSTNIKEGINVERGLKMLRVKTLPMYNVNFIKKGIAFVTLEHYFKRAIKRFLKGNSYSFILFESPPVTMAGIIKYAKKLFHCPAYLMLKDIFPQNAVDLNIMKKNSLIYRYFKSKEKQLYQVADNIGCMSNANKRFLVQHNSWLPHDKVEIFPNTKKIRPFNKRDHLAGRDKYGIPADACVYLFGGNMGKPQYLELLSKAISKCKDNEKLFFMFIGRGAERDLLKNTIEQGNIKNAILLDNLPRNEYENTVRLCDVGLVILNPCFTIPNYPSRILSYMESGIPILAATDQATDFREMIEVSNSGMWVHSGDVEDFIEKINFLAANKELRTKMGLSGRKYLENHFDVDVSVRILKKHFNN